ncbi:hypothetical protein OG444_39015 [Streptomyces sp. NBC_01232]|uniref:hypothetical protein n=1 Tax=Streptomyces sp. NBC_01232 TaxID=2903786 RepID=UPI002E0F6486|nr:hypothetical protein OG444_39015 [Streptomyces sp. NBC_01232]
MDEVIGVGPGDEELAHEAAAVAVSWVLEGGLTEQQDSQLVNVARRGGSHDWMGEAMFVGRWAKALRDAVDGATDDEEGRQCVAVAKDTALLELRGRLLFHIDMLWNMPSSDHPGARESLRRIVAAGGSRSG